MSICPDKIVFSEYVDGELPSPWKEKLEAHLSECSNCDLSYSTYKKISESMKAEGSETIASFDYDTSFEKLKIKLNQRLAEKKLGNHEDLNEKPFWLKSIKLPVPVLAAAILLLIFSPAFVFFASSTRTAPIHTYAYPAFPTTSRLVRNNNKNRAEVNFNSGVTGFLRFYLPNDDNQGAYYKVMEVPAIINIEQYNDIFKNWYDDIEEIDSIKTKTPNN